MHSALGPASPHPSKELRPLAQSSQDCWIAGRGCDIWRQDPSKESDGSDEPGFAGGGVEWTCLVLGEQGTWSFNFNSVLPKWK